MMLLGMISHLDDAVGRIVQTLEDTGMRENTLIVFASDVSFVQNKLICIVTDPLNVIIACARHGVKPAVVKHCWYF